MSKVDQMGDTGDNYQRIWNTFFKTKLRCFKRYPHDYRFCHQMCTDGVGVSLLFEKNDKNGRSQKVSGQEIYINELDDYSMVKNKKSATPTRFAAVPETSERSVGSLTCFRQ